MFALRRPQHDGSIPRGTPRNFCQNVVTFGVQKSSNISETRQDRTKVSFVTNEDEYEVLNTLSIVPTSTTLDDFKGLLCSPFYIYLYIVGLIGYYTLISRLFIIRCFEEFGKINVLKYTLWLFSQQLLAVRFVLEQ